MEVLAKNVTEKKRLELVDSIRGLAVLSMIGYHACWIFCYFGMGVTWETMDSPGFWIWERSICITFIFISGFAFSLGKKQLKRGLLQLIIGIVITVASVLFANDIRDVFGVLWLFGLSQILMIPIDKFLHSKLKNKALAGVLFAFVMILFVLTYRLGDGFLGFGTKKILELPKCLYKGYFMTLLGFKDPAFFSSDYFPLIPWFFMFGAGYFAHKLIKETPFEQNILTKGIPFLKSVGKRTLIIYLVHPVILFILAYVISVL